ncbi:MAG: hypothetical protein KA371_00165 [Acidobacteria bacterium]|nr:hypothetical protein [Acidobacteriota bacterium]
MLTKTPPYLTLAVFGLAVALIYAGDKLGSSGTQALGTAILALGLVGIGVDSLRTRYFDMPVGSSLRSTARFTFKGPGAVVWGLMCLALGLGALALSGVVLFGLEDSAQRLVMARPGIALAPVGFIFLCTALGWLLGDETMNSSVPMFFVTLPHRIGAVITLAFALAVLGVGVFELVAPSAFDRILESLRPPPAPQVPPR